MRPLTRLLTANKFYSISVIVIVLLIALSLLSINKMKLMRPGEHLVNRAAITKSIVTPQLLPAQLSNTRLSKPDETTKARISENYGKLELSFEVNQGQADKEVKFISRASGYTLFLDRKSVV